MTSHVKKIFEEFKELYGVFGNRTYDALDPNDRLFLKVIFTYVSLTSQAKP